MKRTREAEIARRIHDVVDHVVFAELEPRDSVRSFRCETCKQVVHVTDRAMSAAVVGAGIGWMKDFDDSEITPVDAALDSDYQRTNCMTCGGVGCAQCDPDTEVT